MSDSILGSIKSALNISSDDTSFDQDVIMHINSVLGKVNQLGVGPAQGFMITDGTATWTAFLAGDIRLNMVRSYMYLCVRLLFDPPGTSFAITAIEKQIEEAAWRINVQREEEKWMEPPMSIQ